MTVVSFTGTREGCSDAQIAAIRAFLLNRQASHLIHGDCIGADAQADEVAMTLGLKRHIYPCTFQSLRAHCETRGAIQKDQPRAALERNKTIVRVGDLLLVAPKTDREELKSGTWSTYRYAIRMAKHVIVICRDGSLIECQG